MTKNYLKAVGASLALVFVFSFIGHAQTEDITEIRAKAYQLIKASKMVDALPLLEKVAVATPADPEIRRYLAFALMAKAAGVTDPAEAKQLRVRARAEFIKTRELGDKSPLVSAMIEGIPADGSSAGFSTNDRVEEVMQKAEAAFGRGDMDEALANYQKALKMDPSLYYAALFSGDVYNNKDKYAEAETWYQRAIAINPYIETAYRYSATPLMKQGKTDEARARYIEAWITEPYSKLAINGMIQWGQATQTSMSHPKIDAPTLKQGPDGKMETTINVTSDMGDGSMAWIAYVNTRDDWTKQKFAKEFPKEKTYRHSVREETDALRAVVKMAKSLKPKKLNEQIALIEKMDQDGVLEAYVIMAKPDRGIAEDHAEYLRTSRDKLRLYVTKYVIGRG